MWLQAIPGVHPPAPVPTMKGETLIMFSKRNVGTMLRLTVLVFLAAMIAPGPAPAQIPKTFTNLQVLPKDISNKELTDLMKSFTVALGVRCDFCHVGEGNLSNFDFASDGKKNKQTTRFMIRMTRDINDKYIADIVSNPDSVSPVRCVTCHHGQEHPQTIAEALSQVTASSGVDEAVQYYRDLRQKYYGSATFDFSEAALTNYARDLVSEKKIDEALAFLNLNAEYYPNSAQLQFMLGETYYISGNKEGAIASYEKTLQLDPDNEMAQRKLKILKR